MKEFKPSITLCESISGRLELEQVLTPLFHFPLYNLISVGSQMISMNVSVILLLRKSRTKGSNILGTLRFRGEGQWRRAWSGKVLGT